MYVEMKDICKKFGDYEAAKQINFGIAQGKLVALLGPSGSGKTTILRMLAGLEQQDSGDVIIEGKVVNDVPASERGIGFVFQNYALFRYMTVYDNIAFGLKVQKADKQRIHARVMEMISLIGLEGLEKRYPNQLSGGQRQRVAFARAIAPNPQLLLLDEPFAAIDAKVRKDLRKWLKDMIQKVGITSIFVTHDQEEAVEVADDIIIINEGKLEQMGSPITIYKNPKTPFVAQFIGTSTILENLSGFKGYGDIPEGKKVIVRPEFVEAFKSDNKKFANLMDAVEEGVIENVVFRGSYLELTLSVNGVRLTTNRSLERRHVDIGEKMCVLLYRAYLFDEEGAEIRKNQLLKGIDVEAL
ncbi:sulfate/thiosulfate import ATP-binding protein CysA [Lachnospiraceae bacterium]|nr:ABC transporter ATP-binding protein [Eubacterium sp.]GFI24935.1 sulfate/thiosulfate import ATP-binding protein CysA [Lachnospiraceae bacterium]